MYLYHLEMYAVSGVCIHSIFLMWNYQLSHKNIGNHKKEKLAAWGSETPIHVCQNIEIILSSCVFSLI